MDKRNYALAAGVVIVIGIIILWGLKQEKAAAPTVSQETASQQDQSADITYFYRYDCSHCAELSKFLDDNKIADKVNFVKKEIHDQVNAAELEKRAAECKITQIGVPFVYAKGKCYVGTPDAEAFFKQAAGIQ